MTAKELEELRKYAFRQAYFNAKYAWKRLRQCKNPKDFLNLLVGLKTLIFKKEVI